MSWSSGNLVRLLLNHFGIIATDNTVTCAIYAKNNVILKLEGWKRFKRIAKRQGKLLRLTNQAKLRSFRNAPKYMLV